jgi:chromate transport protein ChrA
MKTKWLARGLKILAIVVIAIFVMGLIVQSLWNWLMPAIFGWRLLTFWQAIGLLLLCKLLFGGFRGPGGGRRHWRHRMEERWEQMTQEERERFRKGMQGRCSRFVPPAEPQTPASS